jgi:hypothetical protein
MDGKGGALKKPNPCAINRAIRSLVYSTNPGHRRAASRVLQRAIPREIQRQIDRRSWQLFCKEHGAQDGDRVIVDGREIRAVFSDAEADTALPLNADAVLSTDSDCGARALASGAHWIPGVRFRRNFGGGRREFSLDFSPAVSLSDLLQYCEGLKIRVDAVDAALCLMPLHVLDGTDFVPRLTRRSHSEIAVVVFEAFRRVANHTLRHAWLTGNAAQKAEACRTAVALLFADRGLSEYVQKYAPLVDGNVITPADYIGQVDYYLSVTPPRVHAMDVERQQAPIALQFARERDDAGRLRRVGLLRVLDQRAIATPYMSIQDVHDVAAHVAGRPLGRRQRGEQRALSAIDVTPDSVVVGRPLCADDAAAPRSRAAAVVNDAHLQSVARIVVQQLDGIILEADGSGVSSAFHRTTSRTQMDAALRSIEFGMAPATRVRFAVVVVVVVVAAAVDERLFAGARDAAGPRRRTVEHQHEGGQRRAAIRDLCSKAAASDGCLR